MKLLIRLLCLVLVGIFLQIQFANVLCDRGRLLCMLRNLPHRGLGMIYAAHVMFPYREDFAEHYVAEYLMYKHDDLLSEPQTMPVVAMHAAALARQFPNNRIMQQIYGAARADVEKQLKDSK